MPVDTVGSWVIAGACFFINVIFYGIIRMSGIFFVASMPRYNVGRSAASFPYTFVNFIKYISGPLLGYFGEKFGIHKTLIIGILLSTFGLGACFFVENIGFISLFYGVVLGLGCGSCLLLPVLINQHFDKYRAIASGIRCSGISFGSFMLPPVTENLLKKYGLSGTFLVLSGLVFNCLPAALLLRTLKFDFKSETCKYSLRWTNTEKQPLLHHEKSIKVYSDKTSKKKNNKVPNETNETFGQCLKVNSISNKFGTNENSLIIKKNYESIHRTHIKYEVCNNENLHSYKKDVEFKQDISKSCLESKTYIHPPLKNSSLTQKNTFFSLLFDPVFICLSIERSVYLFIMTCLLTVIVDFASDVGIPDDQQGYTVMAFSIGELIGPLSLGWLIDKSYFSKTTFLGITCYLQSFIGVTIAFSNGTIMLLSLLLAMGCVHSVESFVVPLLVADYLPETKQTVAMTSIPFLAAPLCLLVSPLIGFLRDEIGSYEYMFHGLGVLSAICGSLILVIPCFSNQRNKL